MKWMKDIFSDARMIISAPLTNILCVGGVVGIGASFADFDKINGLSLHGQIHPWPFVTGSILIILGVILFFALNKDNSFNSKLNYQKGVIIKRDDLVIRIKSGEIQKIQDTTINSAIVLPANTTFVDDCASDSRTAMGAFFSNRFPAEIANLPSLFKEILDSIGAEHTETGLYHPGTTIILPDRFSKPSRIIITASTIRLPSSGIVSNPHIICNCIEEVLKVTANQRIDTLFVPILGSGHGGVDRGLALLFLILAIFHYSKIYHHIRVIHIVVHPNDVPILNKSKELRQIVAL